MARLGGTLEKIDQPFWDTLTLSNTDVLAQFFTVGIGGTKTLAQTNLVNPGNLPAPYSFQLTGFSMDFPSAVTQPDLHEIIGDGWMTFFINDKNMLELPLIQMGPAGGLWFNGELDDAAAGGTTDESQVSNGVPSVFNYYALDYPLTIEVKENFRADFQWAAALAGLAAPRLVSLMIHGVLTRAVQ